MSKTRSAGEQLLRLHSIRNRAERGFLTPILWTLLIGGFLVVVIGLGSYYLFGNEASQTLMASFSLSGISLLIVNVGQDDWARIEITIGSGRDTWSYDLPQLAGTNKITIPLLDFVDSQTGKRFNPLERVPQTITISADTPNGRGFAGVQRN